MIKTIENLEAEIKTLKLLLEHEKLENNILQNELKELKEELAKKDIELKKKNSRNAGRKRADNKWTAGFNAFIKCYVSQKSINETMKKLNISRSTYYRYKKLYDDTTL